jgi:hypothetical protein
VELKFVDTCLCGDYRLSIDPARKRALFTPWSPLTAKESAVASRQGLSHSPALRFKDLENLLVQDRIILHPISFDVRTDFMKVTNATTLVPVTMQLRNADLAFVNKGAVDRSVINIFGRVTSLTGRVVETFEDTLQVDVSHDSPSQLASGTSLYRKFLPLPPGRYRLSIAAQQVSGDTAGTWSRGIRVPDYPVQNLSSSSLILADKVEVANVKPRVATPEGKPLRYKRDELINVWLQVYNLAADEKSQRPSVLAAYDIVDATAKSVINRAEEIGESVALGDQVTLKQVFSPASLAPGAYSLRVKVTDNVSKQIDETAADFVVE